MSLQVAMNILNSGRFSMGSACAGMIKKLIGIKMTKKKCFLVKQTGCKISSALFDRDGSRICRHQETVHQETF